MGEGDENERSVSEQSPPYNGRTITANAPSSASANVIPPDALDQISALLERDGNAHVELHFKDGLLIELRLHEFWRRVSTRAKHAP